MTEIEPLLIGGQPGMCRLFLDFPGSFFNRVIASFISVPIALNGSPAEINVASPISSAFDHFVFPQYFCLPVISKKGPIQQRLAVFRMNSSTYVLAVQSVSPAMNED